MMMDASKFPVTLVTATGRHCSHIPEDIDIKRLNGELNPVCQLLALLGAHHILHVSRARVKRRVKSHLPTGGIIRSSPYSPR
jgi:hypothetical protein